LFTAFQGRRSITKVQRGKILNRPRAIAFACDQTRPDQSSPSRPVRKSRQSSFPPSTTSIMSSRKSERSRNLPVSLNPRIESLFHHVEGEEPKFHRRLEKIHTNPAIYLVRNFLSPVDLDYLDRNITQHASKFKASYTEDENGKKCISEERTSTYIFLDKGRDATIRNLEMRASGKNDQLQTFPSCLQQQMRLLIISIRN
jgi:hypothetical protein